MAKREGIRDDRFSDTATSGHSKFDSDSDDDSDSDSDEDDEEDKTQLKNNAGKGGQAANIDEKKFKEFQAFLEFREKMKS